MRFCVPRSPLLWLPPHLMSVWSRYGQGVVRVNGVFAFFDFCIISTIYKILVRVVRVVRVDLTYSVARAPVSLFLLLNFFLLKKGVTTLTKPLLMVDSTLTGTLTKV